MSRHQGGIATSSRVDVDMSTDGRSKYTTRGMLNLVSIVLSGNMILVRYITLVVHTCKTHVLVCVAAQPQPLTMATWLVGDWC